MKPKPFAILFSI